VGSSPRYVAADPSEFNKNENIKLQKKDQMNFYTKPIKILPNTIA
jgi:hypothetical protein